MPHENWIVKRWMSKTIRTLTPKKKLVDAYDIMLTNRIRHLPIVEKGKLVGIISDRNVRQALPVGAPSSTFATSDLRALMETSVEELMERKVITTTPDTSIRDAADTMCHEKISALPVVKDGKLCGIVTSEDLLWSFLENTREIDYEEG